MIQCPRCHSQHLLNTLYCNECGEFLGPGERSEGAARSERQIIGGPAGAPADKQGRRTIILAIGESARFVSLNLDEAIVLGRADPAGGNYPSIDLTGDGGIDRGVSRRHAKLSWLKDEATVEDLGSVNGTFVNGKRLQPYLPHRLRPGDKLQLGKLVIKIQTIST